MKGLFIVIYIIRVANVLLRKYPYTGGGLRGVVGGGRKRFTCLVFRLNNVDVAITEYLFGIFEF